jgi:hypothetical protein
VLSAHVHLLIARRASTLRLRSEIERVPCQIASTTTNGNLKASDGPDDIP